MGCSRFARHYSGNRCFFLFLRLLRCFSSPAYLHSPYVFRRGYPRITTGGFPHSDIPGSKLDQQLPEAYRSRPRPSSAPGAKASTVCSSSLDSNREHHKPLWSFQGARGRTLPPAWKDGNRPEGRQVPVSQNSTVQVSVSTYSRRAPRSGRHCCHHDRGARGGLVPPHSLERR